MLSRDDILRMAREAGLHSAVMLHIYGGKESALMESERDELRRLERFFKLAYEAGAKDEREACAGVCETEGARVDASWASCAAAIRARGQQRPEPTYPSDPIWREQKRLEMEAWARNKLARHGIQIPEDEDGNPSF